MKKLKFFFTLFFIVGGLLTPHLFYSQWVQQSLPVSGSIFDIAFFDANTGLITISTSPFYVLRTTNGGTNWSVISNIRTYQLDKIDSTTVYSNGIRSNGDAVIYRTFDRGLTWDSVGISGSDVYAGISFVNRDTGWVSAFNGNVNLIYRTTNGGQTLTVASTQTGFGHIFFLKQKYNGEYYGWNVDNGGFMFKTTNSGVNWSGYGSSIYVVFGFYFLNKDTGWVSYNPPTDLPRIVYTTNGGTNWILQYVDSLDYNAVEIFFANIRKGWAGRGNYKNYATTDGGLNWGLQDLPISSGSIITFIDSTTGWCGTGALAKTTNGGGVIMYNGIDSNRESIPITYELKQNYPNPFNPQTTILFSLSKSSAVSLIIYDELGKEILEIYNNSFLKAGNYKAILDFSRINISSGVYFYMLKVNDKNNNLLFTKTRKMVYNK